MLLITISLSLLDAAYRPVDDRVLACNLVDRSCDEETAANALVDGINAAAVLESGRPGEALDYLREATQLSRSEPLIASLFGHALIATEDESNYEEAERVLRASVGRDRYNPFAWYQLGVVYAARGDMPRARLASAEQQVMKREYALAMRSAQAAEAGLPVGSPDWLRAQDIGMQARALLEQQCEMSKDRSCRRRR